jgi:hypothetical protein
MSDHAQDRRRDRPVQDPRAGGAAGTEVHGLRRRRLAPVVAGLVLAAAVPAPAQQPLSLPAPAVLRFDSGKPGPPVPAPRAWLGMRLDGDSRDRTRHALLGGAIGAAAGVVFCTVISTLADDSADGEISFCPLDSYLLIGGASFVVGAVIGWVL